MSPSIIYADSHAHLTSSELYDDVDTYLARAAAAGVGAIINICTDDVSLKRGLALSERYPWVYQAASTTPHDVAKTGDRDFAAIAACARSGQLKAVGETGLDYHYTHSPREVQQHFLRRYLQLALECQLPIIIHCREAFEDLFKILDSDYTQQGRLVPGVLHCFTGTIREAEQVIERGWMLSLSGIVTFKKSVELQTVARTIPLSNLLIETDAPYLAPQGFRGKINEPAYVVHTAAFIAQLRGISIEELAQATLLNTQKILN